MGFAIANDAKIQTNDKRLKTPRVYDKINSNEDRTEEGSAHVCQAAQVC